MDPPYHAPWQATGCTLQAHYASALPLNSLEARALKKGGDFTGLSLGSGYGSNMNLDSSVHVVFDDAGFVFVLNSS